MSLPKPSLMRSTYIIPLRLKTSIAEIRKAELVSLLPGKISTAFLRCKNEMTAPAHPIVSRLSMSNLVDNLKSFPWLLVYPAAVQCASLP